MEEDQEDAHFNDDDQAQFHGESQQRLSKLEGFGDEWAKQISEASYQHVCMYVCIIYVCLHLVISMCALLSAYGRCKRIFNSSFIRREMLTKITHPNGPACTQNLTRIRRRKRKQTEKAASWHSITICGCWVYCGVLSLWLKSFISGFKESITATSLQIHQYYFAANYMKAFLL